MASVILSTEDGRSFFFGPVQKTRSSANGPGLSLSGFGQASLTDGDGSNPHYRRSSKKDRY